MGFGTVVMVLIVVGCGSSVNKNTPSKAAASQITGFGATVKAWDYAHVEDHRGNLVAGCCFDPMKVPGLVYGDRYYLVQPIGGRVTSYEMHLDPTSTKLAKAIALRELPPDRRVVSFTVHGRIDSPGSCAIMIVSSARLRAALQRVNYAKSERNINKFLGTPESEATTRAHLGEAVIELSSGANGNSYNPAAVDDLLVSSAADAGRTAQNC